MPAPKGNQYGKGNPDTGRPSAYRPEFAASAKALVKLGATDAELADEFGVSVVTIWRWQSKHLAFCSALKEGKKAFDSRIERSLAQRASGYTFDSEKIFCTKDGNGVPQVTRVPFREHVPPDTTACIFWLKNRRPAEWRDRHEISGDPDNPLRVFHAVQVIFSDERQVWDQVTDSRRARLPAPAEENEV